jgi:hypothetical protein
MQTVALGYAESNQVLAVVVDTLFSQAFFGNA